jgi:hypothetical protein
MDLIMEAANCSEMSVNIYQITWCTIPEDSHLRTNDVDKPSVIKQSQKNKNLCVNECGELSTNTDILEIRLVIVASKLHLLTEGDNIRWSIQIEVLMTPHLASRATTSLHFINQQCSSILEVHPQTH